MPESAYRTVAAMAFTYGRQPMISAFRAVKEDAEKRGLGTEKADRSQVQWAICVGVLSYSVTSEDGEYHATYSTKGCVEWGEV